MEDKIKYKYIFAGLDFLVDKNEQIFFIEANSFPGLLSDLEYHYGKCEPLEKLVELFEGSFILIYPKFAIETWREPRFLFEKLNELTSGNCVLVSLDKEKLSSFDGKLMDVNGNVIDDGVILTPLTGLKYKLEKKYTIINPYYVSNFSKDKLKTYEAVKGMDDVKTPKTFPFRTKIELVKIVKDNHLKKFIIKPRFGSKAKNLQIINSLEDLEKITINEGDWLLQEKIEVKKLDSKFWDIRAFVVNGEYVKSLLRVSEDPIVNVSRGGKTRKIDKNLERRIAPISEACVNAIEAKIITNIR